MGLIFGAGTAIMVILLFARLLPKAIGLALWIGTTGFTATAAAIVLYMVFQGSR